MQSHMLCVGMWGNVKSGRGSAGLLWGVMQCTHCASLGTNSACASLGTNSAPIGHLLEQIEHGDALHAWACCGIFEQRKYLTMFRVSCAQASPFFLFAWFRYTTQPAGSTYTFSPPRRTPGAAGGYAGFEVVGQGSAPHPRHMQHQAPYQQGHQQQPYQQASHQLSQVQMAQPAPAYLSGVIEAQQQLSRQVRMLVRLNRCEAWLTDVPPGVHVGEAELCVPCLMFT